MKKTKTIKEQVWDRITDDLDRFKENMLLKTKTEVYENAFEIDLYQEISERIFLDTLDIDYEILVDVKRPLRAIIGNFMKHSNYDQSEREKTAIEDYLEHRRNELKKSKKNQEEL